MKRMFNFYRKKAWLLLLCCLPFSAFSQDMASVASLPQEDQPAKSKQSAGMVPLKNVLAELSSQYTVNFNYDSNLLEDVYVKKPVAQPSSRKLESSLSDLLAPAGLRLKKVDRGIYVIQAINDNSRLLTAPLHNLAASTRLGSVLDAAAFIPVTGRVTDEKQQGIAGVNVLVKGSSLGSITDSEGKYSINAEPNATLVFSFIGYKPQEVPVNNRSTINVSLAPEVQTLGEVVVTALGIKKEAKKLGYAIASVTPEQINVNRTTNFMNALQGKMAGVNITSLGSGPAGTSKIRIRGQSSFAGQNNPLIVINGIPVDNTNFGANPGNAASDGSISNRSGTAGTSDGDDGLTSINLVAVAAQQVEFQAVIVEPFGSTADPMSSHRQVLAFVGKRTGYFSLIGSFGNNDGQ